LTKLKDAYEVPKEREGREGSKRRSARRVRRRERERETHTLDIAKVGREENRGRVTRGHLFSRVG
jgi:hypothetical protein